MYVWVKKKHFGILQINSATTQCGFIASTLGTINSFYIKKGINGVILSRSREKSIEFGSANY